MRVVVIADIHCHAHEQFATTLPGGRNSRFQNILDVLKEVETFCHKEEVDVLFVLGDVFHSRTKIDVDVYSATWLAFQSLCGSVKQAYILTGNHDQNSKDGRIHSLEAFRSFATVIDQPVLEKVRVAKQAYIEGSGARSILIPGGPIEELNFAAHPFTTDMDSWKTFTKMLPPDLDFFLFHQGVVEANVGAFDIAIKAEVSYTDIPTSKAKWCLMGHYHKQQWLGEDRRAGYPGSPLQHGFAERLEEKGFLFFDTEFGLGCNSARPKFIRTNAPKFVLYGTGAAFFEAFAQDASDPRAPWNRGDFIRVAGCTPEQADKIKQEFPRIQVELARQEKFEENRVSADVATSDETLLQAYIEKETVNGMDPTRLLQFGMEILTSEE